MSWATMTPIEIATFCAGVLSVVTGVVLILVGLLMILVAKM